MHASGEGDVAEPGREAREVGLGGDGPSEREEVVLDLGPELVRAAAVGERSVRQHRPSRRGGGGATGEGTYVAAPIRRLPSPPPALNPSRSARRLPSHRPHRPGAAPALAAPPPSARTGYNIIRAYSSRFFSASSFANIRAVDMNNYNIGPVRGQVLQRPKECALAVLDVLVDGHEHLVLAGGQALLVPLVAGVLQRAGRRADAAPSAPHRVVLFAVAIHCCFLTLRNEKHKTMQLQSNCPAVS
uniref:Uncharacterized protein n=1 Tax=Oryza glumipatula TaxID=40148 RepID=A0A0D9YW51_9ORYZ